MRLEYFQLIDRIARVSAADRQIVAEAVVPAHSTIFEGHFPGFPVMPGVLLVEAMAQTSGWLLIALTRFERMAFLAQIKEAKLRSFVAPASTLAIEAGLLHEGSGFAVTRAGIKVEGKTVCGAELTFRLLPFPNEEVQNMMRDTAKRIGFPMGSPIDA